MNDYSAITGLGSLVKNGAGTLELWHSNSFAEITINDGLTVIDNAAALGGGQLIANGGTLNLNSYSITQTYFSGTNGIITDNSSGSGTTTLTVNNGTNTPCGVFRHNRKWCKQNVSRDKDRDRYIDFYER